MCHKFKFDKRGAISALNKNRTRPKKYRREVRYYYCDECQAWHLTSEETKEEREPVKLTQVQKWKALMGL